MIAVVRTGGKQYIVKAGDKIKVEKLDGEIGNTITLSDVLLISDDQDTQVGRPQVEGASIEAKILNQGRSRKVIIFKYKRKKRERTKKGHRQHFTELEIVGIKSK